MRNQIIALVAGAGIVAGAAAMAAPAQAAPRPTVTKAEVARHDTPGDCWVIVGRSVYDMTAYLPRHPGGVGEISRWCGGRATAAFADEHAGDRDAAQGMANLKIGRLKR